MESNGLRIILELKRIFQRMRVYSIKVIKQNTKTKKKQRSCFTAFKNSVFTSRYYTALQTVDVQELVTVQQMANGNFVKQVVVRRNVWQYKYF